MSDHPLWRFFDTLSTPPARGWPDGVQHHGARVALLVALAVITTSLFPVAVVPDFPAVEAGLVMDRDLIAEIGFGVPKPEIELTRERDQAAAAVAAMFAYDSAAVDSMRTKVARFLDQLDDAFANGISAAETERRLRATLSAYSLPTRPDVIALLRQRNNVVALRRSLTTIIERDMVAGVAQNSDLGSSRAPNVRVLRNGTDQLTPRDAVTTELDLHESAARNLPLDAPAGLAEFQRLVLFSLFVPTLRFDRSTTQAARDAARLAVPTLKQEVVAGERIIGAHERIETDDLERIDAYRTALAELGRLEPERGRWIRVAGMTLLNTLMLAVLGILLYLYRRPVYESLRAVLPPADHATSVEDIQRAVCEYFNIRLADLKSHRRHRAVSFPRMVAMFLARQRLGTSYPELGDRFGGKDHTTVINAVKKISGMLETEDEQTRRAVEAIERKLGF